MIRRMRGLSDKKGMTLIEVMITAVILLIVGIALLQILILSMDYSTQARELGIATSDMRDVMEKIRSTAFSDIATAFPSGAALDGTLIGGFLLPNESIVVTYPNGPSADPLHITVTITWNGKAGTRTYTFQTVRTRVL